MKKIFCCLILMLFSACFNKENVKEKYDFSLLGPDNKLYSLKNFQGENLLIYFGYTLCADVCPTSMAIASQAIKELNKNDIKIIFISLDPKRDNADDTTEFVQYFYKNSIALIPKNDREIVNLAKNYGVKYGYIYQDSINDGNGYELEKNDKIQVEQFYKNNDNENYTVAHSSSFYIFDKNGEYKGEISNLTLSNVKKKITEFLDKN